MASSSAALIGVTLSRKGSWHLYAFARFALRRAGVRCRLLRAGRDHDLTPFDGFLLSGGDDIEEGVYRGDKRPDPGAGSERDRFELSVVAEADRRGVPVFGICRGMELLAVARGGALYPDLTERWPEAPKRHWPFPCKTAIVETDAWIAGALGTERARINSIHSQAIADPGTGGSVVAVDEWGVPQAMEFDNAASPLRAGVQWHPELMPYSRAQRSLLSTFAEEVRREARNRTR